MNVSLFSCRMSNVKIPSDSITPKNTSLELSGGTPIFVDKTASPGIIPKNPEAI
jgi:hypothetical protein